MRLVGNAPSLLTRHVPGVFHSRSNPASNTFPNARNEIEIDRFRVSKRDGRAGEIRTRGLLVPNQALYRAKLPPAQWANDAPLPDPLSGGERGVFKQTIARARPPRASPGPPGLGGCTGPSLLDSSPRTSSPPPGPGTPGHTRSPPLRDDLAATFALEKRRRPPRRRQCDRACESRQPRAWMARKTIQKHLRPLLLRRANASRVNAWIPLQHLDLDARVVTDSRQPKRRPRRLRLQRGILGVSRTHLGHAGIDRHQLPSHARQQRSILAQLSCIAGGNDQPALSQVWRWLASARRSAL